MDSRTREIQSCEALGKAASTSKRKTPGSQPVLCRDSSIAASTSNTLSTICLPLANPRRKGLTMTMARSSKMPLVALDHPGKTREVRHRDLPEQVWACDGIAAVACASIGAVSEKTGPECPIIKASAASAVAAAWPPGSRTTCVSNRRFEVGLPHEPRR